MEPNAVPRGPSPGAVVLALAIPLVFLHERYNPGVEVVVASTSVEAELSDAATLSVVVAALIVLPARGLRALRPGRVALAAGGALVLLALAGALYGPAVTDGYPLGDNVVSALKLAEYALLAPAAALLVASAADALAVAAAGVAWAATATAVGLLQVVGAVGNLDGTPAGRRMPSFLGYHDFAALSGAALAVALALLLFGPNGGRLRALLAAGAMAGSLGLVVSGSLAALLGIVAGAVGAGALAARERRLSARRAAAAAAIVVLTAGGTLAVRSGDVADFVGFLGDAEPREAVETYSHRTLLAYLGVRIALANPVLGTGWQGSAEPASFEPFLDDARRRFPDVAAEAFPSAERPWGVQNAYVQAAADLGVAGLVLLLLVVAAALATAAAGARRGGWRGPAGAAALVALAVAAAELGALGLVPGVPTLALLGIALGVAVASARASAHLDVAAGPAGHGGP